MEEEIREEGMSSKTKLGLIGIGAGVAVAIALIVVIAVFGLGSDKKKLSKAFNNMKKDIEAQQVMSANEKEAVLNALYYGNVDVEYSVNVGEIPNVPVTIGIDGKLDRSFEDKKMSSTNSLSVMNSPVSEMEVYADGTDLYVHLPILLDSTIKADTQDFAKKFNESAIVELLGTTLPEDLDIRPFGDGTARYIEVREMSDVAKACEPQIKTVISNMETGHDSGSTEVMLADGTSTKVKTYHVTFKKDDVQALWDAFYSETATSLPDSSSLDNLKSLGVPDVDSIKSNYENISVDSDVMLTITVDKTKQIRNISTESPVVINGKDTIIDISFDGADSCTDKFAITAMVDSQQVVCTYENVSDGSKLISLNEYGQTDTRMTLMYSSAYENDELSTDISKFSVASGDKTLMQMSGHIDVNVGQAVITAPPTQDVIDILNLGLMDILSIAGELSQKYEGISDVMSMLGV